MSDHEARGRAVYDHTDDEPRPSGRRRRPAADWGVGEEIFDGMPGRRFARDDHPRRGDQPHGEADRPRSAAARADQARAEARAAERGEIRGRNARDDVPRGRVSDGRRTIVITGAVHDVPQAGPDSTEEFASREDALKARRQSDVLWGAEAPGVWHGDEPFVERRDEPAADDPADVVRRIEPSVAEPADEIAAAAGEPGDADAPASRAPGAVVRGGMPGRRTVKIGGRPDDHVALLDRPPRRRPPRTVGERVGPRPDRVAAWAFALGLLLILIAVATAAAGA